MRMKAQFTVTSACWLQVRLYGTTCTSLLTACHLFSSTLCTTPYNIMPITVERIQNLLSSKCVAVEEIMTVTCLQARDMAKELICGLADPEAVGLLVKVVDVEGRFKVCDSVTLIY